MKNKKFQIGYRDICEVFKSEWRRSNDDLMVRSQKTDRPVGVGWMIESKYPLFASLSVMQKVLSGHLTNGQIRRLYIKTKKHCRYSHVVIAGNKKWYANKALLERFVAWESYGYAEGRCVAIGINDEAREVAAEFQQPYALVQNPKNKVTMWLYRKDYE